MAASESRSGKRVLLISANREQFPEPVFPIGAAYVANAVSRAGGVPLIFDAGLHRRPLTALRGVIKQFAPHLVGLSLRNADNGGYPFTRSYVPGYREITAVIRGNTRAPLVAGGPAFSIFPKDIFETLGLDAGVTGDGEAGITEILEKEARGILRGHLPDLNPVAFPENIEEIFPEFSRYRSVGVQTARGCPHRCVYCTYPTLEGRLTRARDPLLVASEIELLNKRHGIRDFFVVDSSFNASEVHATRVLEAILSKNLSVRLTAYLEPKISDPELLHLMKRAGFVAVDFGTDSGSSRILKSMKKGFTPDDVVNASEACQQAGLDFAHSLIFGGPSENAETIEETVRLMDACRPTAVLPMVGIRIYPGTEIERVAINEGLIQTDASLFTPHFYFAGHDPRWLVTTVRAAARHRWNWFFPGKKDWGRSFVLNAAKRFFKDWPLWRGLSLSRRIPGSAAKDPPC